MIDLKQTILELPDRPRRSLAVGFALGCVIAALGGGIPLMVSRVQSAGMQRQAEELVANHSLEMAEYEDQQKALQNALAELDTIDREAPLVDVHDAVRVLVEHAESSGFQVEQVDIGDSGSEGAVPIRLEASGGADSVPRLLEELSEHMPQAWVTSVRASVKQSATVEMSLSAVWRPSEMEPAE